ncbi:uncharacterized protein [Apostichopus japonicus]|uniref:uncharacterized protein n=1 Tax=Stichopus japonicus TaxID=307972 RepID=UPI003AB21EA7
MSEIEEKPSETEQEKTEQEETSELAKDESKVKTKESEANSPRDKNKKEHFVAEFERLRTSLAKESTRIVKPDFKEYSPFIWTSLKPYYNTYTVQYLLDSPEHVRHGYITRKTAIGLVDPEVSHSMDVIVDGVPESKPIDPRETYFWMRQKSPREKKNDKSKPDGSTRLPKWPVVKFQKPEIGLQKEINWGDVPKLRDQLNERYGGNAEQRYKSDFTRTKQDWNRMELEALKDINEVNRGHMQLTCHTYLGTSAGSRKAVSSLAKVLD